MNLLEIYFEVSMTNNSSTDNTSTELTYSIQFNFLCLCFIKVSIKLGVHMLAYYSKGNVNHTEAAHKRHQKRFKLPLLMSKVRFLLYAQNCFQSHNSMLTHIKPLFGLKYDFTACSYWHLKLIVRFVHSKAFILSSLLIVTICNHQKK